MIKRHPAVGDNRPALFYIERLPGLKMDKAQGATKDELTAQLAGLLVRVNSEFLKARINNNGQQAGAEEGLAARRNGVVAGKIP
jgi:hypothetical protein